MTLDEKKLRDVLLTKFDYQESQVDDVAKKILSMDPKIIRSFEDYLETEIMPSEPVFFGSAPLNLNAAYPLKPPAIFLLLDWIRRDRVAAYAALQDEYHYLPEPLGFSSLAE
jgi:hypothetical protein